MLGNYRVAAQLVASRVVHSSTELVSQLTESGKTVSLNACLETISTLHKTHTHIDCLGNMWELQHLTALQASMICYNHSYTFFNFVF
jgi:hypothetical protein